MYYSKCMLLIYFCIAYWTALEVLAWPMQETRVWSLGWEDPLEKEMAIHSSILAWEIPWTEEPGGLQSMGLQSQTWLSNKTTTTVSVSLFTQNWSRLTWHVFVISQLLWVRNADLASWVLWFRDGHGLESRHRLKLGSCLEAKLGRDPRPHSQPVGGNQPLVGC